MSTMKEEARNLVEHLPEHATWDDLMYQIYVRQKISAGIDAGREGRVCAHDEVKQRFLGKTK